MKANSRKLTFQVEFDNEISPYLGKSETSLHLGKYLQFRQTLFSNLQQFIPIDVVPKEPPKYYTHVESKRGTNLYHDSRHNKMVHFPRRDSFEVSVDGFVLFSRLQSGGWPDTNTITEWALRVSTRITDLESDKPSDQNKDKEDMNRTIQIDKSRNRPQLESRRPTPPLAPEERLPPIRHSHQARRGSIQSNYTTLPVQREGKVSRYAEELSEGVNPYGSRAESPIDFQVTKYVTKSRKIMNKQPKNVSNASRTRQLREQQKQTIYYADSKTKVKKASFHWNIGNPRSFSLGNSTTRVNEQNPHKDSYRHKNVELAPLSPELKAEKDRFFSEKKVKLNSFEEKMEKVEVRISDSILNHFRSQYQIEDNRVKRIANDRRWTHLACSNAMPLSGSYYFAFSVLRSVENNVQVGVAPLSYYPRFDEGDNDQQFVSYDCGNGMIKDCKQDETSSLTTWRLGGESAPKNTPFQMRVVLDMHHHFVDWYVEDTIVASAKLPQVFQQGFRVVFSLFNLEDSILLNDQQWKDRLRVSKFDQNHYFLEKQGDKFGKIKRMAESSPSRAQEEREGEFPAVGIDSQLQTQFVGKIRKQRLQRYMEKKSKVDESFQTQLEGSICVQKKAEELPRQEQKEEELPRQEQKGGNDQINYEQQVKEEQEEGEASMLNPDEMNWEAHYDQNDFVLQEQPPMPKHKKKSQNALRLTLTEPVSILVEQVLTQILKAGDNAANENSQVEKERKQAEEKERKQAEEREQGEEKLQSSQKGEQIKEEKKGEDELLQLKGQQHQEAPVEGAAEQNAGIEKEEGQKQGAVEQNGDINLRSEVEAKMKSKLEDREQRMKGPEQKQVQEEQILQWVAFYQDSIFMLQGVK